MEQEVWKDIKGYEGLYQVSNIGRIKSLPRMQICRYPRLTSESILNWCIAKNGYASVRLYDKNGNPKRIKVHRLVAANFLDNPDNLSCINHKDENKLNNSVENLEWCTPKYNTNYGSCIEKSSNKRRLIISATNISTGEILIFIGAKSASEYFNVGKSSIGYYCRNNKKVLGFYWEYKGRNNE